MLARLDQIDGVESSFTNGPGTLIRLSLRPGADAKKVALAVRRVVSEQIQDRVAVQLDRGASAATLQPEEWRNKSQVAEFTAAGPGTSVRLAPLLVTALVVAWAALGLLILWWRQRMKLAGQEK